RRHTRLVSDWSSDVCSSDLQTYEDLNVATAPGQNFGWPVYEGLEANTNYRNSNVGNQYAPNPLFGTGGCNQQYFYFRNLLVQDRSEERRVGKEWKCRSTTHR